MDPVFATENLKG